MAALTGGGLKVRPGEVSLAHLGVLFLDELPEFQRAVLDSLRQPLETGVVDVARANAHVTFPARVQLVAAMNPCGRVAFLLPVLPKTFRALKPEVAEIQGDTLGAHLQRKRRASNLTQKQAARLMSVSEEALGKWEKDCCEPNVSLYPKVLAFLDYGPWPAPVTLAERLRAERKRRGWSIERFAGELEIDAGTLASWESGKRKPNWQSQQRCDRFLTQ
jgi:transcriptional regulator with XRE-family HTH domain